MKFDAPPPPYSEVALPGHPTTYTHADDSEKTLRMLEPESRMLEPGSRMLEPESSSELSPSDLSPSPSSDDDSFLETALDFSRRPNDSACHGPLSKPVAVPQLTNGIGVPFARAWAPSLSPYDITPEEFVTFIDNLNIVATGFLPLQVMGAVGGIVSMVPVQWFNVAGIATQVACGVGNAVVSKTRSALFLKRANRDFFAPRGLFVEVLKGKDFKNMLGLPEDAKMVASLEEVNSRETVVSAMERRMMAMEGSVAHLELEDIPEPSRQTNVLSKLSSKQVERSVKKKEKRMQKKRSKAERKTDKIDRKLDKIEREAERENQKLDKEENKILQDAERALTSSGSEDRIRRAERERDRGLKRIERERAKIEREAEEDTQKKSKKVDKKDKEVKASAKTSWLVIRTLREADKPGN